ncbi:MAG: exodeoxyribonuclease V subunit gamma [Buchnera aphidicola (Schlechtendalia chinensis)]
MDYKLKKKRTQSNSIKSYESLWKTLIEYIKARNQSIQNLSTFLFLFNEKTKKNNMNKFPSRIFIFGNKFLTPYNLIFLKKIQSICKIHFFYVTPYKQEKKILKNFEKEQEKYHTNLTKKNILHFFENTRKLKTSIKEKSNINTNDLSTFGQYALEYTILTNLIQKKEVNLFKIKKPACLLQKIQEKIIKNDFNLQNYKNIENTKKNKNIIFKNDKSISIHECSTLKREIEILHDNLLSILNSNYDIFFHDILIISKDISSYIPFIKSVFNPINNKHHIPFCILSNNHQKKYTILKTIIKILSLPDTFLNNEKIFSLLENPFILKKFQIPEEKIENLRKILQKSQIQFEENANFNTHKSCKNIKICDFSNEASKIFLGKSMNDINYVTWNKMVPYNKLSSKDYENFSKFVTFISFLKKWKKKLSTQKSLQSWKTIFGKLLNELFVQDEIENQEINYIKKILDTIINPGIQEKYEKKISINLLKNELEKNLLKKINIYNHAFGKVTFCNGFILRNIPFKVIHILGMNENFVFQKILTGNFNLIKKYPRICDPNRKHKYKYFFLETLLSAKKILSISYYKNSENNYETHEPSIIISQLLSYISKNFYILEKSEKKNTRELFSHLYHVHTNKPYDTKNFSKNFNFQSFNETWLKISQLKKINTNNFNKTLPKIQSDIINVSDLISFWKHPVKYFFNKRLGIRLNPITTINLHEENYSITKIDHYWISIDILNFLLKQKNIKKLFLYYRYKGIIPLGNLGKIYWENCLSQIIPLYNTIKSIKEKLTHKKIFIQTKKCELFGSLKNISPKGLLRWTPTVIKNKDIIALWIEHLIYCSIHTTGNNSTILGLNKDNLSFTKLESKKANYLLNKYVHGYFQGMNKPILLTNSGINWLKCIHKKRQTSISESKKKIIETWEGNNWNSGEKNDLYLKKVITTLSKENISKICETAKKWILPIIQYTQKNN